MPKLDENAQKELWERRKRNLRAIMAFKGWKDMPLSLEAGFSKNTVNTLLNSSTTPKVDTLERICRVLGLNSIAMLDAENPVSEIRNELYGIVQGIGEDQAREALAYLRERFPDLADSIEEKSAD